MTSQQHLQEHLYDYKENFGASDRTSKIMQLRHLCKALLQSTLLTAIAYIMA